MDEVRRRIDKAIDQVLAQYGCLNKMREGCSKTMQGALSEALHPLLPKPQATLSVGEIPAPTTEWIVSQYNTLSEDNKSALRGYLKSLLIEEDNERIVARSKPSEKIEPLPEDNDDVSWLKIVDRIGKLIAAHNRAERER